MVQKLFLIVFLTISSFVVAQTTDVGLLTAAKIQLPEGKTIANVTAYPNPLNNKSVISFYSSVAQNIVFEVKNVLGRSVYKQTYNTNSGTNEISFNKENLTAGMYIYSIQTDAEIVSKRLVIK